MMTQLDIRVNYVPLRSSIPSGPILGGGQRRRQERGCERGRAGCKNEQGNKKGPTNNSYKTERQSR